MSLLPSYQDQDGEQDEEYETEEQLQARILNAALEFVPLHGWSAEAIAAGAEVRSEPGEGRTQNRCVRRMELESRLQTVKRRIGSSFKS